MPDRLCTCLQLLDQEPALTGRDSAPTRACRRPRDRRPTDANLGGPAPVPRRLHGRGPRPATDQRRGDLVARQPHSIEGVTGGITTTTRPSPAPRSLFARSGRRSEPLVGSVSEFPFSGPGPRNNRRIIAGPSPGAFHASIASPTESESEPVVGFHRSGRRHDRCCYRGHPFCSRYPPSSDQCRNRSSAAAGAAIGAARSGTGCSRPGHPERTRLTKSLQTAGARRCARQRGRASGISTKPTAPTSAAPLHGCRGHD